MNAFSTCAVITIVRDNKIYFLFGCGIIQVYLYKICIYWTTLQQTATPSKLPKGINYKVLYGNIYAMPVVFRSWQINKYQDRLLRYINVSFLVTLISLCPIRNHTQEDWTILKKLFDDPKRLYHRVRALEVGHVSYGNGSESTVEPKFDWNNPYILSQRKTYIPDHMYDKPLLSKVPLRYKAGFHKLFTREKVEVDPELIMLHMRSFDWDFCSYREEQKFNLSHLMKPEELASGMASHWRTYKQDKIWCIM